MTSTSLIRVDLRADSILMLTIDREAQYNALTIAMVEEMEQVLNHAKRTPAVRAILITGAGEKALVAGADIHEF